MREFDWTRIRQGKDAHRDQLAALSFADKLRTVERLRDRTREIKGSKSSVGPRQIPASDLHAATLRVQSQQVAHNAFASVNTVIFGVAPALANAIAPSRAGTTPRVTARPRDAR